MVERQKDPARVQLKNVRLSFAQALYKAKPFGKDKDGEPTHSANFLLDPNNKLDRKNIELMEDAIDHAKKEKWPKGAPKLGEAKLPLRDGNNVDYDGYEDMMFVSANNKKKPRILDRDKQDVIEGDDGAPYSGCFVDAIVRVWAQDNDWGKRVNASLEAVRFRDDGEAFGAAPVDIDEFDDLDDDDRGSSRRSSSRRSRDDDDGDEDRSSRRGRRDKDEGDSDDKSGRRSRRSRDDDDDGDDDGDDKSSRRNRRDRDEDGDDDKSSRRSRSSREDNGGDDRSSRRGRRDKDDDDSDEEGRSRRSRRDKDEDDDEDRPSRNSRSRRDKDADDDGGRSSRRSRRNDDI